jgi:hypothetical protein
MACVLQVPTFMDFLHQWASSLCLAVSLSLRLGEKVKLPCVIEAETCGRYCLAVFLHMSVQGKGKGKRGTHTHTHTHTERERERERERETERERSKSYEEHGQD